MEKEKSCGAVITRKENGRLEILIIHQVQGHWCFPKGHVEGSENEQETAVREVKEETGLNVILEEGFRKCTGYSPKPGVMKDVVYFIGHPKSGREKVQESELLEEKWVTLAEANAAVTFENDRVILRDAVAYLRERDPQIGDLL